MCTTSPARRAATAWQVQRCKKTRKIQLDTCYAYSAAVFRCSKQDTAAVFRCSNQDTAVCCKSAISLRLYTTVPDNGMAQHGRLYSLTCFKVFMTSAVLATFSLDTTRDRSATLIKRMYSCCISAKFSARLVLAHTSLLLFSVSSRTMRIRLSHSCVCTHTYSQHAPYCSKSSSHGAALIAVLLVYILLALSSLPP